MSNPYSNIPSYEDAFGGEYFSPADLHEGPVTAKIVAMNYDELFCKGVGKNRKIVLTLEGQKKRVVVNKVNGKAAVLLKGIKQPAASKPTIVEQALAATQGTLIQNEPGTDDGEETEEVVFVKMNVITGNGAWKYALIDANGVVDWRASDTVGAELKTMKASGRKISVTHMAHCIVSVKECLTSM